MRTLAFVFLVALGGCKTTMIAEKPEQASCGCSIKTACDCKNNQDSCMDKSCKES